MKKQGKKRSVSRRGFLKTTGIVLGGGAVLLYFGRHRLRRFAAEFVANFDLPSGVTKFGHDLWFEIKEDNRILMRSPKIEMGQGVLTGLAMLAAEELAIPIAQININHDYPLQGATDMAGTGGSSSTGSLYVAVRETAATLREMLLLAAAKMWDTDRANLTTQDGIIKYKENAITFAQLNSQVTDWKTPKKVKIKERGEFEIIGTDQKRVDLVPKVLGKPVYGLDQSIEGMLHAVIARTPYIQGTIESVDSSKAAQVNGVEKIIKKDDWVAVVAQNRWAAEMGARALDIKWSTPKQWQQADMESIVSVGNGYGLKVQDEGNAKKALKNKTSFKASYRTPLGCHAQMEPNGVIAHHQGDTIKLIAATQDPNRLTDQIKKEFGVKKDNIDLMVPMLGGGFGRRYFLNIATEALTISKEVGKPISLFRTREEEFLNGYLRPNTHHKFEAVLDKEAGKIKAISHDQAFADMMLHAIPMGEALLGADFMSAGHGAHISYDIEHMQAKIWHNKLPMMTGIWRGVGCFPNGFAVETFMDECAVELGVDPFDLRIQHLTNSNERFFKRKLKVVNALRKASNWDSPKAENIGRGVAIFEDRKTICGAVVEVQIVDGQIKVKSITHISNPAIVVNPEGARMQAEGAIMMGLSASMYEAITVKDAQIEQQNYNTFQMARLSDTPKMNVILMEDEDAERPYGMGEPPIAPVAPAIGNAIFNLTGQRLTRFPFQAAYEATQD